MQRREKEKRRVLGSKGIQCAYRTDSLISSCGANWRSCLSHRFSHLEKHFDLCSSQFMDINWQDRMKTPRWLCPELPVNYLVSLRFPWRGKWRRHFNSKTNRESGVLNRTSVSWMRPYTKRNERGGGERTKQYKVFYKVLNPWEWNGGHILIQWPFNLTSGFGSEKSEFCTFCIDTSETCLGWEILTIWNYLRLLHRDYAQNTVSLKWLPHCVSSRECHLF